MKQILLVDDESHVLRVMQHALEHEGYSVMTARNGELALEQLRKQLPDAMVMDVQMPRMSGDQLCQVIACEFPDRTFPIIVATSRTEPQFRDWSRQYDNVTFQEKPLSIRVLLNFLREFFERTED